MKLLVTLAIFSIFWAAPSGGSALASEKSDAKARVDSIGIILNEETGFIPTFDSTTTLEDYLKIAMKRNPGLHSAFNRWTADLKKSDYAGSFPDPVFSYAYFVENVETRVGPQEQRFGLKQSFPWFGTLGAREDMAFAMSQVSFQKFQAAKLRLFYQVKAAYYDYYYLGQDLTITRENFELLKFWESVAQAKYKTGLKQHPDVIRAQVELGKLEDHILTLQEKKDPVEARLRALLNLPDEVNIPVPSSITVDEVPLVRDTVINLVRQNNPDLKALQNIIESERAGESYAARQSLPSFTIGVDYIMTGEALDPSMPESGKDPWMIGASISLPIWFGKNSARRGEAEARRRAAEYELRDSENRLTALAEKVIFEYSDALRKTQLYRDGLVPKAEQSLNAIYAAYQAGETDFLNLLDAQRQLLDFQLTVVREKARLGANRAMLEMLSGTNLEDYTQ